MSDDNINPDASMGAASRRKLLYGLGVAAAGAGMLTLAPPQQKAQAAANDASYYSYEPSRFVDTRLGWGAGASRISGGQTQTLSIFAGLQEYTFACNLTVVATQGTGYLAVYNADIEERPIPFSSINWQGAGKIVANFTMLDLGTTGVKVYCSGDSNTGTDYIMDVIGVFITGGAADRPLPAKFTAWEKEAKRSLERDRSR